MMKTLALLAILHLATLTQGSKSAKSPGCGEDPVSYNDGAWKMKKLQFQDQFAVQGEIKRTYQVRLPKSKKLRMSTISMELSVCIIFVTFFLDYDKDKAYPLIFKAHGYRGASGQAARFDFGKLINQREDFILVAPDGYSKSYNVNPNGPEATYGILYHILHCRIQNEQVYFFLGNYSGPICTLPRKKVNTCPSTCNPDVCKPTKNECYIGSSMCVDDLGFIEEIQTKLKNELCIDVNQMHYAGFSYGGVQGWNIASQAVDGLGFASFYILASVPFLGNGMPPEEVNFSLFDLIGNVDKLMPPNSDYLQRPGIEGHDDIVENKDGMYKPVKTDLLNKYAEKMGCEEEESWPTEFDGIKNFECFERKCQNGKALVRCNGDFGHHPYDVLDGKNGEKVAPMILDFMLAHPRK